MPRTGCVKVDVTAPVLDTGVLCFCTGQLEAKYSVGKGVGDGGYAVVKMAIHRELGTQHAVKFIRKRLLFTEEERASVKREVDIHVGLRHENVVRLSEAYEDEKHAMLVMEWVPGGSLQSLLKRRARKVVPVDQVRVVVKQVVAALKYLHSKQIVHGDLKPENILIGVQEFAAHTSMGQSRGAAASTGAGAKWASLGPMTKVKLCDFGNARRSRDARYFKTTGSVGLVPFSEVHGTMGYIAPEVLGQQHYSHPVDMWALGVLTFTLLSGQPPFRPYHNCQVKNAAFDAAAWQSIPSSAVDFCAHCLRRQPNKRLTAKAALQHPWIAGDRKGAALI